jgi:hypothetical protein
MRMRSLYGIVPAAVLILSQALLGQGLSIGSGTAFSLGSSVLSLTGNWSNSGVFDAGSGTVAFSGPSGNQTVSNSTGETFFNITVNKAAGDVVLAGGVTVNGVLTVSSGDVDLNGNVLTLGSGGMLSETAGNTVKGAAGHITCSSDLNAPSAVNPHGIGVDLTSAANLGVTTIVRGHAAQTGDGNTGIRRVFEITPANNASLGASVVFHYDESELNGIPEAMLQAFRSENAGLTWAGISGCVPDADANTVSFGGLPSLSRLTLASSDASLPVRLSSFNARVLGRSVVLAWVTESETDNLGYILERSAVADGWSVIASYRTHDGLKCGGNTSSRTEYAFTDTDVAPGAAYAYRLSDVSASGAVTAYPPLFIRVDAPPEVTDMNQAYPNPFNPVTVIGYQLSEDGPVGIAVFDLMGRKVKSLHEGSQTAGSYQAYWNGLNDAGERVPSGCYFIRMETGSISRVQKVMLMK